MRIPVLLFTLCSLAAAEPLECDFSDYRWSEDLQAEAVEGDIVVWWRGGPVMWFRGTFGMTPVGATRLRARIGLDEGKPVIREVAMVDSSGKWVSAIRDARPGFAVAEWARRPADQSRNPVSDARPDSAEVSHSKSAFSFRGCRIRGGAESLEVSLRELTVGSFRGSIRFSARHGSDELWQEAVVSPSKPLGGYAYYAGLVGLGTSDFTAVRWIDDAESGRAYRSLGGMGDANESDVLHGDLGELASERGVSLTVILPTGENRPALRDGTIRNRTWFLRRPDGRFNVGVHSRRSQRTHGSGEDHSAAPTGSPDGFGSPETSEEAVAEPNGPHRMGVVYRLDRHWTSPARFRSSSP